MGSVAIGSLGLALGLSLVPLAYVAVLLRHRQLAIATSRAVHHIGRLLRHAPEPGGPPLEVLAAKLRRLRALLADDGVTRSMPKQRGTLAAYDDALVATARALGVPTCLDHLPPSGFDRDVERLRLEDALAQAGLVWEAG